MYPTSKEHYHLCVYGDKGRSDVRIVGVNVNLGRLSTSVNRVNRGALVPGQVRSDTEECTYHSRANGMCIQRKWQGEVQGAGTVERKYIPTPERIAVGLTKPLARDILEWVRRGLGIE